MTSDAFNWLTLFSFPTRKEVDHANQYRLARLAGQVLTYEANDFPGIDSKGQPLTREAMDKLLERLVVPKSVQLKIGAQVMLVKVCDIFHHQGPISHKSKESCARWTSEWICGASDKVCNRRGCKKRTCSYLQSRWERDQVSSSTKNLDMACSSISFWRRTIDYSWRVYNKQCRRLHGGSPWSGIRSNPSSIQAWPPSITL